MAKKLAPSTFRVAAGLLRRLGEELNPSFDQSVLELVKNAYDADATTCKISLFADKHGTNLRIEDDGAGMDYEQIRDGWLVLGSSLKEGHGRRTPGGRLIVGSKGLGRLAALRLGSNAKLTTTSGKLGRLATFEVSIDWKRFDAAATIEEVEIPVHATNASGLSRGTTIEVRALRDTIGRMEVKRLARSLVLLADPFGDVDGGFQPTLESADYRDLGELVKKRYFSDAEFHLHATLDKDGHATAALKDWRGATLFRANHKALTEDRQYAPFKTATCTIDLWAYLLKETAFSTRSVTLAEVRAWLEHFGGVHLYHNGMRVRPYGDAGHDWLELNLRRARSPEQRPSTNNSIGRIVVLDPHGILQQKTDRVGFVEDEPFRELKAFADAAIEWMARRRMDLWKKEKDRERAAAAKKIPKARDRLVKALGSIQPSKRKEVEEALVAYDKSREKETKLLREDLQLYRTLATAGIVAATFAHEVQGNPIKVIRLSVAAIRRRLEKIVDEPLFHREFADRLGAIGEAIDGLSVLATSTLSLLAHEKRRPSKLDLHEGISATVAGFQPFLDQRKVKCRLELATEPIYLHAPPAALESIVANLLNNAIAAFEHAHQSERSIIISTVRIPGLAEIHVEDSGTGIEGIALKDIWLPGQTTRPGGTGLGLTIVRDVVRELGGEVSVDAHGAALGGASFCIRLERLEE